jgi:hypothetical protein
LKNSLSSPIFPKMYATWFGTVSISHNAFRAQNIRNNF